MANSSKDKVYKGPLLDLRDSKDPSYDAQVYLSHEILNARAAGVDTFEYEVIPPLCPEEVVVSITLPA